VKRNITIVVLALFGLSVATAGAAELITGKDIKNGSITSKDLSRSTKSSLKGQRGPRGPAGARGTQGAQGPAGPSAVGQMAQVSSGQVFFGDEVVQSAVATCPSGQRVVTGGGGVVGDAMNISGPLANRAGWIVAGTDLTFEGGEYVQAFAYCAPANVAVASRAEAVRPRALRELEQLHADERRG
jgi:hypothetical protein